MTGNECITTFCVTKNILLTIGDEYAFNIKILGGYGMGKKYPYLSAHFVISMVQWRKVRYEK